MDVKTIMSHDRPRNFTVINIVERITLVDCSKGDAIEARASSISRGIRSGVLKSARGWARRRLYANFTVTGDDSR